MACRDRQAGTPANQIGGGYLVRGIARREIAADRHGRHVGRQFRQSGFQRREIERRLVAMDVVAAGHEDDRIRAQRSRETGPFELGRGEPDHHQGRSPALSLNEGVGRQRRRHGCKLDRRRGYSGRRQYIPGRLGNPDRKVVARGQRLGLGDDAAGLRPQHGIGIGAAGVQPEKDGVRGRLERRGLQGIFGHGTTGFDHCLLADRRRCASGAEWPQWRIAGEMRYCPARERVAKTGAGPYCVDEEPAETSAEPDPGGQS